RDIDHKVEQQDRHHTVTIDPRKACFLPLCHKDQAVQKTHKQDYHNQATDPSKFFAQGAKDKICVLFGDKVKLRLSALQIALAQQPTGTDGDLRLGHIPSYTQGIQVGVEQHHDSVLLVLRQFGDDKVN